MLWLAGLMGVMAVGAASFVGVDGDADSEEISEFESYKEEEELLDQARTSVPAFAQTSFEADPGESDGPQSELISQFLGDMNGLNDAEDTVQTAAPQVQEYEDVASLIRNGSQTVLGMSVDEFLAAEAEYYEENPEELDDDLVADGWDTSEAAARIMDYDGSEDDLVLVWDDSSGIEPELSISPDEQDPGFMNVQIEGETVAQVPSGSGLSLENIALVPSSTASMMGWAEAA